MQDFKSFADIQQHLDIFMFGFCFCTFGLTECPPHGIRPISVMHDWHRPNQDLFGEFFSVFFISYLDKYSPTDKYLL